MRYTGVTARGIISPIFKEGDNLKKEVCDAILTAANEEGFSIDNGDIIGITESIVARTQGNYATCDNIIQDIQSQLGCEDIGIVFPILSRNRFSILLKAIAGSCKKLTIQLSYPGDEVGNTLLSYDLLDEKKVNPYTDHFTEKEFRHIFGNRTVHSFTGVDYIETYKSFGNHIDIIFSNDPTHILKYTKNILCCDIHSRKRTKKLIQLAGAKKVIGLDDLLTKSIDGCGYNEEYGLLGSNMSTENTVKLFPRDCQKVVNEIQDEMKAQTGKTVEVLVYGDGCFKDPVGGIWELADPVVSPAFTKGLVGTPNEIKIKYFADNELGDLSGDELAEAMQQQIKNKDNNLVGAMASQGTTPRRYTDLIGSLCDLVSGSGDRGTPVIFIKGYFTNYATQ